MAKNRELNKLFSQFTDLLEKIQTGEFGNEEVPPGLNLQLERVKEQVSLFKEATEEALKQSGVEAEEVVRVIQNPEGSPVGGKEKALLQKANFIRGELERLRGKYVIRSAVAKKQLEGKAGAAKKRRKKFKRFGGQGWMPL